MKLTGYYHLRRETALLFSVRRYASLSHFVDLHHALFKYMLVALNNTKKNSRDVTWLSSAVLLVLPFYSSADSPRWKDTLARY
jgi:hypothetical protein